MNNMNVLAHITITVKDMKDGVLTGFVFEDRYYTCNGARDTKKTMMIPKCVIVKNRRYDNLIDKWIRQKNIRIFTLDDLYRNLKSLDSQRKRAMLYLSKMCGDKTLTQHGDKFYVSKYLNNNKEGKE